MLPDARARFPVQRPYDLRSTVRFVRLGAKDPTTLREEGGMIRAAHTTDGPATVRVGEDADGVWAEAWGPGAGALLARVPRLVGLHEAPWRLAGHPAVERLLRGAPGLRLSDAGDVWVSLVGTILQQLITWEEAVAAWRKLVEALGEPAPGPFGLRLPPTPRAVRDTSAARLVSFGIAAARVGVLQEVASYARRVQAAAELPTAEAQALLQRLRGVGPWTAASVLGHGLGHPDAVVVGDLKLPDTVRYVLEGVERGDDADLQRLLLPFVGQRFRVIKLIMMSGEAPPRRSPKPELWARR